MRILLTGNTVSAQLKMQFALEQAFRHADLDVTGSGAQAGQLVGSQPYYLVVIGIDAQPDEGFELIAKAARKTQRMHVVAAASRCAEGEVRQALAAGAEGYLLLDESVDELSLRLCGLTRGHPPLSPQVARLLMRACLRLPPIEVASCTLSSKEQQVLGVVARGLRVKQIAEQLGVTENTVQTHVRRIYTKLNISSRAEATVKAAQIGLI